MKTNVTLKIDTDLLREARIMAATEGSSISALLARSLEREVRKGQQYEQARKSAQARLRAGWNLGWTPPKSRDELHER
jgi:hypothetical protein